MQAEAHYNKIKAPFILHHQLYLHIFIKKRYSTIAQAATISFPKGVNASPASLKCWIPKGMPIMGKTDINITLTADIDLTGKDWTPIGTDYDNAYTGTFDGGGHTITGLTVTTNDQYAGLFGYLGNFGKFGTVKNVVMDGIQITCNHRLGYAGGVAGYSRGTIENCSVSGSVSGTVSVGGVVGAQRDGSITGCSSSATVKGTLNVGGEIGRAHV